MKEGDNIVVVKGSRRGRTGKVLSIGGECGGEIAVNVILTGKRYNTVTFFPKSYVVETK